jgi:putative transcriptional regulator
MINNPSIRTGTIIEATHALAGSVFEHAIIYIVRIDDTGVVGFVVNKQFNRRFNELTEFSHYSSFLMFDGGPVDHEHLYFLHRRPDLIADGTPVDNGVYFGGDFQTTIDLLQSGTVSGSDVRLFVGYCGWDIGELESEMEEGSWVISHHTSPFD